MVVGGSVLALSEPDGSLEAVQHFVSISPETGNFSLAVVIVDANPILGRCGAGNECRGKVSSLITMPGGRRQNRNG